MNKIILSLFLCALLFYECSFCMKYDAEYHFLYSLVSFKLYFSVLSQSTGVNDPCFQTETCKVVMQSIQRCYCDQACVLYDDCCFNSSSNDTSGTTRLQQNNKQFLSCETEAFRQSHYGIWMTSMCPANYSVSIISENCTLANNTHPVTADDGTTFRNVYCAYCHNVRQYQAWRFEFLYEGKCPARVMETIPTIPNKMRYVIENNCKYRFVPPSHAVVRSCLKHVVSETTNNTLCSKFQSPIEIDNKLYRNVYCYNSSLAMRTAICVHDLNYSYNESKVYSGLVLTKIFNIRPVLAIFGQKVCQENFVYDFKKDTCVPKICRDGDKGRCDVELLKNYKWQIPLDFVTNDLTDKDFHLRFASFIYLSLPTEIYQINMMNMRGFYTCGQNKTNGKSCCVSNTHIDFSSQAGMTLKRAIELERDVNNMKWAYSEIRNKSKISVFDLHKNKNLTFACNITEATRTRLNVQSAELISVLSHFVINKRTAAWTTSMEIPKVTEGTTVISEGSNGSIPKIKLKTWNLQYKNETNETHFSISESSGNNDWAVGTILTYSTVGISCCSLLLTICVYRYLGLFESMSGVISKYMLVTMLAAQLLFIVGAGASYIKVICTAIGIVSHYLWLCFFTWTSVFFLSVLKMMRLLKTTPGALTKDRKLSKLSFCFVFMLPLMTVLPCALLDTFTEVNVGYSDGDICFPTGSVINFFCFTLPVIISLSLNIVILVITSVKLSRYNTTTLLLLPVRQTRSYIPTYIRLSILCAFPWILGIIADITQADFLRYSFVLLAGSHGTFVSMSFLFSKPVRRFFCNR